MNSRKQGTHAGIWAHVPRCCWGGILETDKWWPPETGSWGFDFAFRESPAALWVHGFIWGLAARPMCGSCNLFVRPSRTAPCWMIPRSRRACCHWTPQQERRWYRYCTFTCVQHVFTWIFDAYINMDILMVYISNDHFEFRIWCHKSIPFHICRPRCYVVLVAGCWLHSFWEIASSTLSTSLHQHQLESWESWRERMMKALRAQGFLALRLRCLHGPCWNLLVTCSVAAT